MTSRRERLLAAVTVLGAVVFILLVAEVVLGFLPVATGFRTEAVTAGRPVFHFAPNRDFIYSRDWDLAHARSGHVNNAGFVNDQDYQKEGPTPLLAVVGDSYIEAAIVPYAETLHGRLAHALKGEQRVYSFGASGAALSQYLVWARHAVRDYGAQALVINVVGNDFDESHYAHKWMPGFWYYAPDENGALQLRLVEYQPGRLRELVHASALASYVVFNLQVLARWGSLKSMIAGARTMTRPYAGNTAADADPVRIKDSLAAIDAFFRDLPEYAELPPSRILFLVDGSRYPDAAATAQGSYFDQMRKALLAKARELGYEAIDLDPLFFAQYRANGERFEYINDGHWNPAGHRVAFRAVMESRLMARLIPVRVGAATTMRRME